MRQYLPNFALFVALSVLTAGLFYFFVPPLPPKPTPQTAPPKIAQELAAAVAGAPMLAAPPFDQLSPLPVPKADAPKPVAAAAVEAKPAQPLTLIALGDDKFFLKILLTNRGAGVQQLKLTRFDDANRLGLENKDEAGKNRALVLIPGYHRPWSPYLKNEPDHYDFEPNLSAADFAAGKTPGPAAFASKMARPSYVTYHYPSRDDPARARDDKGELRSEDDFHPLPTLGERPWKVTGVKQPTDGSPWEVAFEADLGPPYFLRLRKTYSLAPKDYDFKLTLALEPLPGRKKEAGAFRYQMTGAIGMPVEGEWYTSTYRNAYVGWTDGFGRATRNIDDPATIHSKHGADKVPKLGTFHYAAVGTQYFASALVVDNATAENQPWEYVRATREQLPTDPLSQTGEPYDLEKTYLYDIGIRAVSPLMEIAPEQPVTHSYAVYNGPMKVRLLRQLEGPDGLDPATVERYMGAYHLDTLSDYHSPYVFGRVSNAIYWSDLLIFMTNIMHGLLGWLHGIVGSWGVSIMLLTVLVKLCLIVPSRRQQAINANMQARIATVRPELDALNEKHRDNFMMLSQEKAKLFKKAGVKQSAQMGGCLLLFAQMPILMGLYYCLQESVFFRLERFLWMPNLAAPDMLAWWGEGIPMLSSPDARFGSFSFVYLGPFFNLLPMFAVVLFYVQQKLTMPPPTDEQQEMQQKMMKYMLGFSALFFYKVAAGLCVYFIVSGLWSLFERTLVPKPKIAPLPQPGEESDTPPKPAGWLGRKMAEAKERMEEMQKQAGTQRQIRNDPKAPEGQTRNERRAAKKQDRKKK